MFRSLHCSAVFTRVMALVSAFLHRSGIHILLWRPGPSGLRLHPSVVLHVGHCGQREETQLGSVPAHNVSGHVTGFSCFQGFSLPTKSGEASINRRRIPVLRRAASIILAGSAGRPLLSYPSYSRGLPPHAVSPASPSLLLGLPGRLRSRPLRCLLPPRPPVVAGPASSGEGGVYRLGGPRPLLLVRHFRCGVGLSPRGGGGFGPLVSR